MSAEIFESGLQQQLYSKIAPTQAAAASAAAAAQPTVSVYRRIVFFVVLFLVCGLLTTIPSWALLQPFQQDSRQQARGGGGGGTIDTSPPSHSAAPVAPTSLTSPPSSPVADRSALSVSIEKTHRLLLDRVSNKNHDGSSHLCLTKLFLFRDEILTSGGLSWRPRANIDELPSVQRYLSELNASFVPEIFAPFPKWSNDNEDAATSPLFSLNVFQRRFPECSRAVASTLQSPELSSLVAEMQRDISAARRATRLSSSDSDKLASHVSPPSTTYTRRDAWSCLRGKRLLFIGSSNTRTLMTNVQARLEGTMQMSRVAAKQWCDDSTSNHSCSVRVSAERFLLSSGSDKEHGDDVHLLYVGYKDDLFDASLKTRIDAAWPDVVIMNTGINSIQKNPNWHLGRGRKMLKLKQWIRSLMKSKPALNFIWHSISSLCPNMPHFRRYRFKKGAWSGQSVDVVNSALKQMNAQVAVGGSGKEFVFAEGVGGGLEWSPRIRHLDVESLLDSRRFPAGGEDGGVSPHYSQFESRVKKGSPSYCRFYEDPLHHRFLDRAIVDVFMSMVCI